MHIPYWRLGAAGVALAALVMTTAPAAATPSVPGGGSAIAADEPVTLTLTLAGAPPDKLDQYATAVATPNGASAHRFLDRQQLRDTFGASPQQVARVSAWARTAGFSVDGVDSTGTRLTIHGTARTATAALHTGFHRTTIAGVSVRAASSAVQIPASVDADVVAVTGLTQQVARPMNVRPQPAPAAPQPAGSLPAVPQPASTKARPAAGGSGTGRFCSVYWGQWNADVPQKYGAGKQSNQVCGYSGPQLRSLYGLSAADTGAGQTIVIVGAYNNPSTLTDANTAFAANGVPALPAERYQVKTYPVTRSSPVNCDQNSWHLEQGLDVQTVHTIAPGARIVYVPAADCTQLEETLAKVIGDPSLHTSIVSNSWGLLNEPTKAAAAAANSTLARAAILGIGTYFASGDYGDTSTLPGGHAGAVSFPASSPWVTAVGGTTTGIGANNTVVLQTGWEDAANTLRNGQWARLTPALLGGAGGGARSFVAKPTWQSALPGNKRMVPDISALADPFTGLFVGVTLDGTYQAGPVGGTSLATPIVASLAALAQAKTHADIGLLAPVLYAKTKAGKATVTDVKHVAGGIWSPGISTQLPVGDYLLDVDAGVQPALTTRTGYDPVTGLGVPGRTFIADIGS